MEPLAHTLFGATLGHALRARDAEPGRGVPVLLAVVAANAPDLDVLAYLAGDDFALGFRRGVTHGVLAMAVWPPLLVALLLGWRRRRGAPGPGPPARRALLVAALACWSHPLLDWLNDYGIRLLSPFSDRWFYGDAVFIVDPWMWLILGGALALTRGAGGAEGRRWLALATLCALVLLAAPAPTPGAARLGWMMALGAVALAARRSAGSPRRGAAIAGLVVLALYAGSLLAIGRLTRGAVASELGLRAPSARELMVGPLPMNPGAWRVVLRFEGGYRVGERRPLAAATSWRQDLARGPGGELVEAAWSDPAAAGFARWVRFPFHRVRDETDGRFVYLLDARYATGPTAGFGGRRLRIDGAGR
ncbi:MAG TPA: metal-dependent hydrolase [Thermoanaerobaculia bacterium]|nr:metal-dependent hydrolase [Thermoanaerobaculia bacterium]